MKFFVQISCLLVASFAILGTEASIDRFSERWRKERESFRTGLKVTDDYGSLVELTIADGRTLGKPVNFYLYYNTPRLEAVEVVRDSYTYTTYNTSLPTVFITHGWSNSRSSPSCGLIRDAYLRHGGYNVIVVDWTYTSLSTYEIAATQVGDIGFAVADIIKYLSKKDYLKIEDTILVGHSLGAHVMGAAGNILEGAVKAIFGLDPALPLFKFASVGSKLTKQDAKYVEIIHTNAGHLGSHEILGHADFFVNGGVLQRGCNPDVLYACSHNRAYEVFAESINSPILFEASECNNSHFMFLSNVCNGDVHAIMGGAEPHSETRGIFGLSTNPIEPFAIGNSTSNSTTNVQS